MIPLSLAVIGNESYPMYCQGKHMFALLFSCETFIFSVLLSSP